MKVNVLDTHEIVSYNIAREIIQTIIEKPNSLICLAGGNTPLKVYEYIIELVKLNNITLDKINFVSLDEWVDLGYKDIGSTKQMLFDNLFYKLSIDVDKQVCFFDGKANDLVSECQRIDEFIKSHGCIDFLLLGVGMNGHLGFNEPGVNDDLYSFIQPLDLVTQKVGMKYFNRNYTLTKGITLGMKHIYEATRVVVMATGKNKQEIIKDVFEEKISNLRPASLLRNKSNTTYYLDKAAASLLKEDYYMDKIIIEGLKDERKIDIKVSKLLMGAGDFLRLDNAAKAFEVLDEYVLLGGNCFDTARHYRYSEEAIGEWLRLRNNRDKIVIFTKGCHPTRKNPNVPRVNAQGIRDDINESLVMLQTNYIDLFALHRDDLNTPVSEIIDELDVQVRSGKVLSVGVSNWTLNRIIEANEYAQKNNKVKLTFNSVNLSLATVNKPRWVGCITMDNAMLKWHQENNFPLISWSAQAGGFFSERFGPKILDNVEMVDVYYNDVNWQRYEHNKVLSSKYHITPVEMSLAYVLNQSFPCSAAIGCETIEELRSSNVATKIKLNQNELAYLELQEELL